MASGTKVVKQLQVLCKKFKQKLVIPQRQGLPEAEERNQSANKIDQKNSHCLLVVKQV